MSAPPELRALLDAFYRSGPSDTPITLLRTTVALLARSTGSLRRAHLLDGGRPVRGGPWCPALFGPLEPLRCECGALSGTAHRGERCGRCGVLCTDDPLRDRAIAQVDAPFGLVHPALAPRIAALLGLSADAVLGIARGDLALRHGAALPVDDDLDDFESVGPLALWSALQGVTDPELAAAGFVPGALVFGRIPIPPPALRPLIIDPCVGRDRWFTRLWGQRLGPDNEAITAFAAASLRAARLTALGAPPIILHLDVVRAQRAFEAMLAALAAQPAAPGHAPPLDGWRPDPSVHASPLRLAGAPASTAPDERPALHGAPHNPLAPRACALLPGDRALVQLAYALLLIHWPTGHVLTHMPASEATLLGVAGHHALFGARYGRHLDEAGRLVGLHALDLDRGLWLEGTCPADLPAILVEKDQPEDAWLVDWRRGRRADVAEDQSGDRPQEVARSADHRLLWVSSSASDGAVMDAELGAPVMMLSWLDRYDPDDVPTLELAGPAPPEDDDGLDDQLGVGVALAHASGDWRVLFPGGRLHEDDRPALRLTGGAIECAAFDHAGARLLVVNREALHVIDVDGRALLGAVDLRPLAPALTLPSALPALLVDALLLRHGTAAGVLARPDVELRSLPGLGPARLRLLRAHPTAAVPERLPSRT